MTLDSPNSNANEIGAIRSEIANLRLVIQYRLDRDFLGYNFLAAHGLKNELSTEGARA